jgi:hypothetical protein
MAGGSGCVILMAGEEVRLRWSALAAATPGLTVAPTGPGAWALPGRSGPWVSASVGLDGASVVLAEPEWIGLEAPAEGIWARDRRLALCRAGCEPDRRTRRWLRSGGDERWRRAAGPGQAVVSGRGLQLIELGMGQMNWVRLDCLAACGGGAGLGPGSGASPWIQARGPAILVLSEPEPPRREVRR